MWGLGHQNKRKYLSVNTNSRRVLVFQWLRICLPMQGTQVWLLVWKDLICCWAASPMCHNSWSQALEPENHNYWSPHPLESMLYNLRCHHNEKPVHNEGVAWAHHNWRKAMHSSEDSVLPKINKSKFLFLFFFNKHQQWSVRLRRNKSNTTSPHSPLLYSIEPQ